MYVFKKTSPDATLWLWKSQMGIFNENSSSHSHIQLDLEIIVV